MSPDWGQITLILLAVETLKPSVLQPHLIIKIKPDRQTAIAQSTVNGTLNNMASQQGAASAQTVAAAFAPAIF